MSKPHTPGAQPPPHPGNQLPLLLIFLSSATGSCHSFNFHC